MSIEINHSYPPNDIEDMEAKLSLLDLYDNFIHNPLPNALNEDDFIRFSSKGKWVSQDDRSYQLICERKRELRYRVSGKGKFYFNICPFHNSQYETYDFMINPKTNQFYCYGCHKKGSVFSFIQNAYHLTPLETVQVIKQIIASNQSNPNRIIPTNHYSPKVIAIFKHLTTRENSSIYFDYAQKRIKELNIKIDNYLHFLMGKHKLYPLSDDKIIKIANRLCVSKQLVKKHLNNFQG